MVKLSFEKIPTSIGIIMDGNRRWARERGLPAIIGHRSGADKLEEVVHWAKELGIPFLVVYAFSTENWHRSDDEVSYLMNLLRTFIRDKRDLFKKEGIRLKVIGQREKLSKDLRESIDDVERETRECRTFTLAICISYGGRAEILAAINSIFADPERSGEISEEEFTRALWTADMPDPDLIIRTGGEHRLSGFLPWQSVYSELFFIPGYWPAFDRKQFEKIIAEYGERQRRHGK